MTFDPGQSLVRIVVRLLNQPQFLSLTLVETRLHTKQKRKVIRLDSVKYCTVFLLLVADKYLDRKMIMINLLPVCLLQPL